MNRIAAACAIAIASLVFATTPSHATDDLANSTWTVFVLGLIKCDRVDLDSSNRFDEKCRVGSGSTLHILGKLGLSGDQDITGNIKLRMKSPKLSANCRVNGVMTWMGDGIAAVADCGKKNGFINFSMVRLGPSPWQESSPPPEASEEPPPSPSATESSTPAPVEGSTATVTREYSVIVTDGLLLGD